MNLIKKDNNCGSSLRALICSLNDKSCMENYITNTQFYECMLKTNKMTINNKINNDKISIYSQGI